MKVAMALAARKTNNATAMSLMEKNSFVILLSNFQFMTTKISNRHKIRMKKGLFNDMSFDQRHLVKRPKFNDVYTTCQFCVVDRK
ncbi:MAG: hypothetical protein FJX99_03465 [Bacteroidetes bacterium]|nr:hypothetical protein [Bacteroidota bacterium]